MHEHLTPAASLPADGTEGTLVGRAWVPGDVPGPSPVAIRDDAVFDLSRSVPTMSELLNAADPVALAHASGGRLGSLAEILANSAFDRRDPARPYFLAPADLQAIKASGVTFATSLLERVIEEQARGDAAKSDAIRRTITAVIGTDLSRIRPGSEAAMRLKEHLIAERAWSQYLEVGIGPDAEIFTKCPPMAAVGTGSAIGVRADSSWNNPEPELVVAVNARGAIVGATLGNDVNLRDVEGRSALLLGKAKDNNASTRDRAVRPAARRQLRARPAARGHDQSESQRRGRLRAYRCELDEPDQPRCHRPGRSDNRRQPPVSGRSDAVLRHDVRADPGP